MPHYVTSRYGHRIGEPSAATIHDREAAEEHRCAFCDACAVSNPNDFCSDECEALAARDLAADDALDAADAAGV